MELAKPWERQPGESDLVWSLFREYRDSAYPEGISWGSRYVPRRLNRFAELRSLAYPSVAHMASAHFWTVRSAAYDQEVDRERQKLIVDDMERVRAANVRSITTIRGIVEIEITKHLARAEEDPAVPITTLKECVDMLTQLIRMETMLLGKGEGSTIGERQSVTAKRWNLEALAIEDLEALERARERAGGPEPVLDTGPVVH